jgi:hypothetical protein
MFAGMNHHVVARNARPVVPLAKFLATEASGGS